MLSQNIIPEEMKRTLFFKVEIFLEQREVAFLSSSKIFANFALG
jgi:hypothetical protein